MNGKAHGQLGRSQVITTFGPGALIDLPSESAIVGGLDTGGSEANLEPVDEPRLASKLTAMTGVHDPRLYAPPPEPEHWQDRQRGIGAWRFPEWFVVQESNPGSTGQTGSRSRRMVRRTALDRGRFDRRPVVATRFVRACSRGHVDDIDWHRFVHGPDDQCRRQLRLDERGTSGDLAEQIVRCECGKSRRMHEATDVARFPLGTCSGARPWLGRHAGETCELPSRLLIRTASNAWFPQVLSVLSLPDRGTEVDEAVAWRRSASSDGIESVIQVHRLREVMALAGFTRLEPVMPNVDGEYEAEVERTDIALEPTWFPAVENRGEGIVLQLHGGAVTDWLDREAVQERLSQVVEGHVAWARQRHSERHSVADDGPGGVLHAKAVVADDEAVFITSANLTEAAFDRNIELGLLARDRTLAATTVLHFRTLIEQGLLQLLPSS